MRRWLVRGVGLLLVLVSACGLMVRGSEHDPAVWHIDPLVTERTGKPNDYLAAPEGTTAAAPDRVLTRAPADPLGAFDRAARAAPRVEVVAGAPAEGFVTYVQRSALIGFPDYVSVRAVETPSGPSLAVWSRSRYGYSDLGVNKARIEGWLAEAGFE